MDKTVDIDRTVAKNILQNKGLGNGEKLNEFEKNEPKVNLIN